MLRLASAAVTALGSSGLVEISEITKPTLNPTEIPGSCEAV
jgi:hypothetical protein